MTFRIERLRKYLVGHKPAPNRPHHMFEQHSDGFLVTGYEDGSDWLVSPLGRYVYGGIDRDRPDRGWAIAADRRNYHRMHLYMLDLPSKSFREVAGLPLTREFDMVDYDAERLVFICPPADAPKSLVRELVVVDIASARVADRFALAGITHIFAGGARRTPDGWIIMAASRLGENNERIYIHGIARFHPLTRESAFEIFPGDGLAQVVICPSGRYVLTASRNVPALLKSPSPPPVTAEAGEAAQLHQRAIEVWAGNPLSHVRNLPLEWVNTGDPWAMSRTAARIFWQPDQAAFWWVTQFRAICVGMDGRSSPPIRVNTHDATVSALPGRTADLVLERPTTIEIHRLDGSPSEDLSPLDAPAPTVMTPDAAEVKRQRNAQAALKRLISANSDLRFTVGTSAEQDIVAAIDAITAALDRGLGWFAEDDGRIKLAMKIDGATYNETRFFALVEKLGPVAAPALTRLLARCRRDPDFPRVWSGELEDGRQAFGDAAKALAGIDPGAWVELADYQKCIDDFHELYFRAHVIPHFLKSHGWREESFTLALADIVQVRANLGDDFTYSWRRSGLAAAAEADYPPATFAQLMLAVRDRMLASAAGTFAVFAARVAAAPAPAHGWHNYDRLFDQLDGGLNQWETRVFEELRLRSGLIRPTPGA